MLAASDPAAAPGPMLTVDSVVDFQAGKLEQLAVVDEPSEIPGGWRASYRGPGGEAIDLIDQSTDQG